MSKATSSIKKNDTVQIISGRDASAPGRVKRGRVMQVLPEQGRVVVEGMNIIKRHTRPNPQKNVKGGIIEREAPLHVSNVQLVCPECGAVTRVGRRRSEGGRSVRFCVKCKGVVDK